MAVSLMLVDDDPLALASLTQTLRRHLPTAIVEAFGDPTLALPRLQDQPFAVIVTDFSMPAINGFGLLRSAREAGSDAAFIVMTGDSIDSMLVEGLRFGVFGIIDKPINRLALIALIQQAIESHRLRQEVTELRRTLIEAGTELGSLVRGIVPETEEAFQPPLPY